MSRGQVLTSKQEIFLWKVWVGSKIVVVHEAGESTVGCRWNDVIGEFQVLIKRLVKKNVVLSIEQKSGLRLDWRPLVDV